MFRIVKNIPYPLAKAGPGRHNECVCRPGTAGADIGAAFPYGPREPEDLVKKRWFAALAALVMALCAFGASADGDVPQPLYSGIITHNFASSYTNVYREMDTDSEVLDQYFAGRTLRISAVYPNWVEILYGTGVAYVIRHRVDRVVPLNEKSTPPYGVWVNRYYTIAEDDILIHAEKDPSSEVLSVLTKGARLAMVGVEDGWGVCVYHRQWGYVDTSTLSALYPVSPCAETETDPKVPIAIYCSFYSDNVTRTSNLAVCCLRLNRVMKPGDSLNFNGSVGPFKEANGYLPAPVLIDGGTTQGYGGGSCQVSSTLYNTVLQLPGVTVTERHPHGSNGAPYLPHGTDASSGNLNFRIRNDYPFPIRLEGSIHDFCLFIAVYREAE